MHVFSDKENESSQPEQDSEEEGAETNIGGRSVTPFWRRVETYDATIERLETRDEVTGIRVETFVRRSTRVVTVLRSL